MFRISWQVKLLDEQASQVKSVLDGLGSLLLLFMNPFVGTYPAEEDKEEWKDTITNAVQVACLIVLEGGLFWCVP